MREIVLTIEDGIVDICANNDTGVSYVINNKQELLNAFEQYLNDYLNEV